jgi:hypothetical protein
VVRPSQFVLVDDYYYYNNQMKENGLSRESVMACRFSLRTPKEGDLFRSSSALRIIILK